MNKEETDIETLVEQFQMVDAQFGGIKKDTLKVTKSIPQRVCEKAMI